MQGFKLNPNEDIVRTIMEGLIQKEGHCPCQTKVDDTTLCPCDKFLKEQNCCCKLYVKID